MTIQEIDAGNAVDFARTTIGFGRAAFDTLSPVAFSMPHMEVRLASDSGNYMQLARRALVDDPAFAKASQTRLEITVIDRQRHPELPQSIWRGPTYAHLELTRLLADSGLDGLYSTEHALWRLFDPATGSGIEALAAPGQMAPWDTSFPLRDFLHWGLQAQGTRVIHAGTLGVDGNGALLIGPGGSGKSGTTLAGITRGLDSVGDDYIAVAMEDGRPIARPLIRLMKQDAKGLARVGIDASAMGEPNWQNKYEFDYAGIGKGRRAEKLNVRCILLPRIGGGTTSRFSKAHPREAMLHLAPSNLHQLPGGWRHGLSFIADIVRAAPAYHLDLSSDADEIADAVGNFLSGR